MATDGYMIYQKLDEATRPLEPAAAARSSALGVRRLVPGPTLRGRGRRRHQHRRLGLEGTRVTRQALTAPALRGGPQAVTSQGACIWFTGLSGSGKSTTAEALVPLLRARGREVTVLDGDVVRTHLSAGLGFSREDRDTNVRRVGYVAGEVVRHGGLVVAAVVSPYREARATRSAPGGAAGAPSWRSSWTRRSRSSRRATSRAGTPRRAPARSTTFTGVDDPYEPPLAPELTLRTTDTTPEANARSCSATSRSGATCASGLRLPP